MKTLTAFLSFTVTTLQSSSQCRVVRVVETHFFSKRRFAFKVRAELVKGEILQVRLYYNQGHIDYAYQLVCNQKPVIRWDNKEHFFALSSHPHHFHNASGQIEISHLTGDPAHDLIFVLNYLESTKT